MNTKTEVNLTAHNATRASQSSPKSPRRQRRDFRHPKIVKKALRHSTLTDGIFTNPNSEMYWAAWVCENPWAVAIGRKLKKCFAKKRRLDVLVLYGAGEGIRRLFRFFLPGCRVRYASMTSSRLKTLKPASDTGRFDIILTNFYDAKGGFDQSVCDRLRQHRLLRKDGLWVCLNPQVEDNPQFETIGGNTERTLTE